MRFRFMMGFRRAVGALFLVPCGAHAASLVYSGGPVVGNAQIVMVDWGSYVASDVTADMPFFYADIVQSDYWTILGEYGTPPGGTNQAIGLGTFAGAYTIAPSHCPGSASPVTTCTLTETQIQTELQAQVAAQVLPAPSTDVAGHVNTVYMVHFPPLVQFTLTSGGYKSCQYFCAAYSNFTSGALAVPAGLVPDQGGACAGSCGGGAPTHIGSTTYTSDHILANIVTDPLLPSSPPNSIAWYDSSNGNIADICLTPAAQTSVNGHSYYVAKLWSNANNFCIASNNQFVVQLTAGANGTVAPDTSQGVVSGRTTQFTVTPDTGFAAVVAGTCGGSLAGSTYTTNAVIADCTVTVSFSDRIFASTFETP